MDMVKKNIKKKFLLLLIFLQVIFLSAGQYANVWGADLVIVGEDGLPIELEPMPDFASSGLEGPTLNIMFETDVDGSGKIGARAITNGFNGGDEELYFTWYLKKENGEDLNRDGGYDEEDWKIEAARIVAANGYSGESNGNSSNDGNDDGYESLPKWSGSNDNSNCYVQDFEDGRTYELKETTTESFSCANPVCVSTQDITCSEPDVDNPEVLISTDKKACQIEAVAPECKVIDAENFTAEGACGVGATAQCPSEFLTPFASGLNEQQLCSALGSSLGSACPAPPELIKPTCNFKEKSDGNICKHLFAEPNVSGEDSGDGKFGESEEEFWGTDPKNTSTAGNGKMDEANVIGLGINSFKWNYEKGDKVGLVVEGESVTGTKHNDGRKMITWAFSKNTCKAISDAAKGEGNSEGRRFYVINNHGLPEGIMTIGQINLNDCLEENLLDPTGVNESGYLNAAISITPTEPINDPLGVGDLNRGSVVTANAVVDGTTNPGGLSYEWDVEVSSDGTANPPLWKNITDEITEHGYLSGLGNSEFSFKLNFSYDDDIFPNRNEEQYLKIKTAISERAGGGRTGKGEVIVKIRQLGPEITPFKAVYSETTNKLSLGGEICSSENPENIGSACFVSRNEVIGVSIPDEDDVLSGFFWKINGAPLGCDDNIASGCSDGAATNLAFFPILGTEGDMIEITAEALDSESGSVKTFSKKFQIIKPYVRITSADQDLVWPKQLGFYKNLDGTFAKDVSENLFQVMEGQQVRLEASFFPDFIADEDTTQINWTVGAENFSGNDKASFTASDKPGETYNVSVKAIYIQSTSTRKALEKFWGVPPAQTTEEKFEHSIQIEVIASEYDEVVLRGVKKFLASVASNVPEQAMFLLKIILTGALLVGISGMVFYATGATRGKE